MQRLIRVSPCLVFAVVVLCSGCTANQIHRFGYLMGSRYACIQRNSNLPNAAARKADCSVADPDTQRSYEAYQRARKEPAAD